MCPKGQCRKPLEIEQGATKVLNINTICLAYSVHKILTLNANNVNLFVSLLRYSNTLYIYIYSNIQNGRHCNNCT